MFWVRFQQPTVNAAGFTAGSAGSAITAYQVQYDTASEFNSGAGGTALGTVDVSMYNAATTLNTCAGSDCTYPLGAEVPLGPRQQ